MTEKTGQMMLKAIGTVRNEVKESQPYGFNWPDTVSEIVIDEKLTEALDGLEGFSHIIVIWWMHRMSRQPNIKIHPRGNQDLPLTGLFATRSPHRFNPLGKATVKLLERRGNILKVRGLDALDGTPVVDIKPYMPGIDAAKDATVPAWTGKK